jgi:hypothetical protein
MLSVELLGELIGELIVEFTDELIDTPAVAQRNERYFKPVHQVHRRLCSEMSLILCKIVIIFPALSANKQQ